MSKTITVELRAEDAEPILRQAAYEAARYGAWLDCITRKTGNSPMWSGISFADWRTEIIGRFLRAKRMVEAFGVEHEATSEEETLTVDYHWVGGTTKVKSLPGIGRIGVRSGSTPDYKHPYPSYRGSVHNEACHAAANRVVRAWREITQEAKAA